MLHTDAAASSLGSDVALAEFHINAARRLLAVLASRAPHDPRAREFITHWYELAPSFFLVVRKLDRAAWLVQEGFDRSPHNPTLHTYKGIIVEMSGAVQATVVARGRGLSPARAEKALEPATQEFRLALKADSRFALARLHLGRIHFLADDNRARADLEQALADATDPSTRYLAHLFLGEVAERDKRQSDALREFEAAIAVGPRYQTGYVAAARMADALGESDRARELAMACVAVEKNEDPWWDYQVGGVNMPMPLAAPGGAGVMTRAPRSRPPSHAPLQSSTHRTDQFSGGVEVVELDVSVTRGGQPVGGLSAQDFSLTDNGVAQVIDSVTPDQLPLSVLLALDTSQSVSGDRLRHLVDAGEGLIHALRRDDRAGLLTFSHAIDLAVPMTDDVNQVVERLRTIEPTGSTALRDAVQLALDLRPRDRTRTLLLVFTDGEDTSSWLSASAVLDSARRAAVVVHVVRVQSDTFLDRLADVTGGRTWSATSDRQLRELFTRALEEMRARYLVTYTPRAVSKPGWHELRVKVKSGGADVTTRPGYFVTAAR